MRTHSRDEANAVIGHGGTVAGDRPARPRSAPGLRGRRVLPHRRAALPGHRALRRFPATRERHRHGPGLRRRLRRRRRGRLRGEAGFLRLGRRGAGGRLPGRAQSRPRLGPGPRRRPVPGGGDHRRIWRHGPRPPPGHPRPGAPAAPVTPSAPGAPTSGSCPSTTPSSAATSPSPACSPGWTSPGPWPANRWGTATCCPTCACSEGRFLDGMTPAELPRPVEIVPTDGLSLRRALEAGPVAVAAAHEAPVPVALGQSR